MSIRDVKIFEKGGNRWISMPCRDYQTPEGEKRYFSFVAFDDEETRDVMRDEVITKYDAFMKDNAASCPF